MSFIKISNPDGGPLTMDQRRELAAILETYLWRTMDWAIHPNEDDHDGTLHPDCTICEGIAKFPCQWCGYGAMFYTHNLLAHSENGDPICQEGGFGENNFTEEMLVEPWRDWFTALQTT